MKNAKKSPSKVLTSSRRKLYLAVAAQLMLSAGAHAVPTGGNITGGEGAIEQSGLNTTIIQNSPRLSLDWNSFDIQANERVEFVQPDSSSVALNRILSNDATNIFGQLDANGHVILMNPNGIIFGKDATVNVGGLVASGLAINPEDFMNGDFAFSAVEGTNGAVINRGVINASTGGNVALMGRKVENEGLISAKLGTVTLAAGKQSVVTFDDSGMLGVRVTEEVLQRELGLDPAISNSGSINAEGGKILLTGSVSQDIFTRAVNAGEMNAKASVVVHDDGSFTLGGGANVINTGTLDVSSTTEDAGDIVVLGDNVTHSGRIFADSQGTGKAGHVEMHSVDTTLLTEQGSVSATAVKTGVGGDIKILGERVGVFDQAKVDATGRNGGGEINIGGGFQGKNKQLRNATRTVVTRDTQINADAVEDGDGGNVVIWADQTAAFTGEISVRGGESGGDGGFVEVSGKENLKFSGRVDRTAAAGENGTLLLDPEKISVSLINLQSSTEVADGEVLFGDVGEEFLLDVTSLKTALAEGDVILEARGDIEMLSFGIANEHGTIPTEYEEFGSLILSAGNNITVDALTSDLIAGSIVMSAGVADCGSDGCIGGEGNINIHSKSEDNVALRTSSDIILRAANNVNIWADIEAGNISVFAGGDINVGLGQGESANLVAQNHLLLMTGALQAEGNMTLPSGALFDFPELVELVNESSSIFLSELASSARLTSIEGDIDLLSAESLSGYGASIDAAGNISIQGLSGRSLLSSSVITLGGNLAVDAATDIDFSRSIITPTALEAPASFVFKAGETITLGQVGADFANGETPPSVFSISTNSGGATTFDNDIYTNSGRFDAIAGSFVFADGMQINTGSSNIADDALTGTGNVTITSGTDLLLPNIRTHSGCLDATLCGLLDISARDLAISVSRPTDNTLSVFGDTTFDLAGGRLNLSDSVAHPQTGLVTFDGSVSVRNAASAFLTVGKGIVLGDWTIGGTVEVTNTGAANSANNDIVADGALLIDGSASFVNVRQVLDVNNADAPALGAVLLSNSANTFGALMISASTTNVSATGDLVLQGLQLTGGVGETTGATSTFTATGNVTQASGSRITGAAIAYNNGYVYGDSGPVTLEAGGDVVLDQANLISSVEILDAQSVTLSNSTDLNIAGINAQSLTLNAEAEIKVTQSGAITIAGETSLNAGEALEVQGVTEFTLDNLGNDFSVLNANVGSSAVFIEESNDIVLGSVTSSLLFRVKSNDTDGLISQASNTRIAVTNGQLNLYGANVNLGAAGTATIALDGSTLNSNTGNLTLDGEIGGDGSIRIQSYNLDGTFIPLDTVNVSQNATFTQLRDTSLISMSGENAEANLWVALPFKLDSFATNTTVKLLAEGAGANTIEFKGGGVSSLTAFDTTNAWTITSLGNATLDSAETTINIIGVNSLIGGTEQDTFNVATADIGGMSISGSDSGLFEKNVLVNQTGQPINWRMSSIYDGTFGDDMSQLTYSNINILQGGDPAVAQDVLYGLNKNAEWTFTEAFGGELAVDGALLTLHDFGEIHAGTGIDWVTVASSFSSTFYAGAGNDVIEINNALGGYIYGGEDDDTFNVNTVTFRRSMHPLDGGEGDDTVVGLRTRGTNWRILQNGDILYDNAATITGFENIKGATEFGDTFLFSGAGDSGIFIDAGDVAGIDTVDYSQVTGAIDITLGSASTGGVTGAEKIIGNSFVDAASNFGSVLRIDAASTSASIWEINEGESSVSIAGGSPILFEGFNSLAGGGGVDRFNLNTSFSGEIRGGAGEDTLDGTALENFSVNLQEGTAGALKIHGIDEFIATGGSFTGVDLDASWILNQESSVSYTDATGSAVNARFTGFNTVLAGDKNDTVVINGVWGENAQLVTGEGPLDAPDQDTVTVAIGGADAVWSFNSDDSTRVYLDGPDQETLLSMTWVEAIAELEGVNSSFNIIGAEHSIGSAGRDTFLFYSDLDLYIESIDGAGGSDAGIAYAWNGSGDVTWNVTGDNSGDVNGWLIFKSLESLKTFEFPEVVAARSVFNVADGVQIGRLIGSPEGDVFNIGTGASVGGIDAGLGADTIILGDKVTVVDSLRGSDEDDAIDILDISAFSSATEYDYDTKTISASLVYEQFETIINPEGSGFYGGAGYTRWVFTGADSFYIEKLDADGNVFETSGVYENEYYNVRGGEGPNVFILADNSNFNGTIRGDVSGTNSLEGSDLINQWLISGSNAGSVSDGTVTTLFTGIAHILGGGNSDRFTFSDGAMLTGGIDGGAGQDSVNLQALSRDIYVRLDDLAQAPAGAHALALSNINQLTANAQQQTVLLGASDQSYSWVINGARSGEVTSTMVDENNQLLAFENITAIAGGEHDDIFRVLTTNNAIRLAGGSAVNMDIVDYSEVDADLRVALADLNGFEWVKGNNNGLNSVNRAELIADDSVNTWTIGGTGDGVNDGQVESGGNIVRFENFNTLTGGADVDVFNQAEGVIVGEAHGGAGSDVMNITVSGTSGGTRFIGGAGDDTLNIGGASVAHELIYTAAASGGQFNYRLGDARYSVSYEGVELINEISKAAGIEIQGTAAVDNISVADGYFSVNNSAAINHSNKSDVIVRAAINDFVQIIDNINIAGTFGVINGTVISTDPTSSSIVAQRLLLENTRGVGASEARIRTNIDDLALVNVTGDVFLHEQSGLNLASVDTSGELDLVLVRGNLTNTGIVSTADDLRVFASDGDITLSGNNQLRGDLTFSGNSIDVHSASAMNFALLNADSLKLVSQAGMSATGAVKVAGDAVLSAAGNIVMINQLNDFNRLAITQAQDVSIVDQNRIELGDINTSGRFDLRAGGILIGGNITSGSSTHLVSETSIEQNGSINAGAGVDASARDGDVVVAEGAVTNGSNISIRAKGSLQLQNINGESINVSGGELVVSGGNLVASGGGINVESGSFSMNVDTIISAGDGSIRIAATDDVVTNNDVTGDSVSISGNDVTIGGNVTAGKGSVEVTSTNNTNVNRDVTAATDVKVSATQGSVNQVGSITAGTGSVAVSAGNDGNVMMGADAVTEAKGGDVSVSAGQDVVVGAVRSPGTVTFDSAMGGIIDGNGDSNNVTSGRLVATSERGLGDSNAVETDTRAIDASSNTGNINVANTGDVKVDRLATSGGNVGLNNNEGDVTLGTGSVKAKGATGGSSVSIDLNKGSVKSDGPQTVATIDTDKVRIKAPEGAVGEGGLRIDAKQVSVSAKTRAGQLIVKPDTDLVEYFSGSFKFEDQLLAVEPLEEINPAVFTNVQGYFYNDVSLRMPADQRVDEDEE